MLLLILLCIPFLANAMESCSLPELPAYQVLTQHSFWNSTLKESVRDKLFEEWEQKNFRYQEMPTYRYDRTEMKFIPLGKFNKLTQEDALRILISQFVFLRHPDPAQSMLLLGTTKETGKAYAAQHLARQER